MMISAQNRRKLRKLQRDPKLFFQDLLRKRMSRREVEVQTPSDKRRFDLALFLELNEEYRTKPVVPAPPKYDADSLRQRGRQRVEGLNAIHPLPGARILEIGCGHAEVVSNVARSYPDAEVIGIDVQPRKTWSTLDLANARVEHLDITRQDFSHLGTFDFIYSFTVWEHIVHPYSALQAAKKLLAPGGRMYLTINLYRGTQASHLYRDVFFPWPHLLFEDDVFAAFYRAQGKSAQQPAWVNKLTGEQYECYFRELGLEPEKLWYRTTPIDEKFYRRFEDVLSRYPRRDLAREYLNVVLSHAA